jgi:glycosyltransferase involved in cell wall biosynthesis
MVDMEPIRMFTLTDSLSVIHNSYSSKIPSGENDAVLKEFELLNSAGANVTYLSTSSDELDKFGKFKLLKVFFVSVLMGFQSISNSMKITLKNSKIVHIHNTFPFFGFRIIRKLHKKNKKIVLTIHNARISCLAGSHRYSNSNCYRCSINSRYIPGIIRRCYRGDFLASFLFARYMARLKADFKYVDKFIVLNEWAKNSLQELNIDPNRIVLLNNATDGPVEFSHENSKSILFAGRLTEEKGVELLVEAWCRSNLRSKGWELRIAGAGPLESELRYSYKSGFGIKFLGYLSSDEINSQINASQFVCVPSLTFEGFPNMVSRAAAFGRGVLVTNFGPLGALSHHLWINCIDPDIDSWVSGLNALANSVNSAEVQFSARRWWENNASTESVKLQLIKQLYGQ